MNSDYCCVYILVYMNKKTGATRSRCWLCKTSYVRNRHRLERSHIYVLLASGRTWLGKPNTTMVK